MAKRKIRYTTPARAKKAGAWALQRYAGAFRMLAENDSASVPTLGADSVQDGSDAHTSPIIPNPEVNP